jgi:uncharacterized protein
MMKKLAVLTIILFAIVVTQSLYIFQNQWFKKNIIEDLPIPRPLLSYSFENLRKTEFPPLQIGFGDVVSEDTDSQSLMFYFSVPKSPGSTEMLKVSGLANIPKQEGEYPIVVMFRGFIPENVFKSGAGTQPSARALARNGFITIAPDFLGFGESDDSADSFEGRFQTYTTALSLLSSLSTLNDGLEEIYSGTVSADLEKVGIWGHSNGGHIALSTLAISGKSYPTVLWNPVSKSFPYSILYYTDEYDDQGKDLRKALSNFEDLYDTEIFSPEKYYNWISAPILVNQGLDDQEVPYWWSDDLTEALKKREIDVTYLTYPQADHNMLPSGWNRAIVNTIDFYKQHLYP